jgi:hypothetical protein
MRLPRWEPQQSLHDPAIQIVGLSDVPASGRFADEQVDGVFQGLRGGLNSNRGTLQLKTLRHAVVITVLPWDATSEAKPEPKPTPKERRDPLKLGPPLPGSALRGTI